MFAKVPKKLVKSKFELRSIKCVLVGYVNIGGYHLFDQVFRTIVTSCDIIFNKSIDHMTHINPSPTHDLLELFATFDTINTSSEVLIPKQPIVPRVSRVTNLHGLQCKIANSTNLTDANSESNHNNELSFNDAIISSSFLRQLM